jgi:hypothetical protein
LRGRESVGGREVGKKGSVQMGPEQRGGRRGPSTRPPTPRPRPPPDPSPPKNVLTLCREMDLATAWNPALSVMRVMLEAGLGEVLLYMGIWLPWPFRCGGRRV